MEIKKVKPESDKEKLRFEAGKVRHAERVERLKKIRNKNG